MTFDTKTWKDETDPLGPPADEGTATPLDADALNDLESRISDGIAAAGGGGGGSVDSVTAGDDTITVGGTDSDPTIVVTSDTFAAADDLTSEVSRAETAEALLAPKASPTFTGTVTVPTPTGGDNTTKAASTAYVQTAISTLAPKASPALTGNPTAPTQSESNNSTRVATTAYADRAAASAQTAAEAASDASGAAAGVQEDAATMVFHGSTASTARPSGWGHVTWVGSVQPDNIDEDTDLWVDTSS